MKRSKGKGGEDGKLTALDVDRNIVNAREPLISENVGERAGRDADHLGHRARVGLDRLLRRFAQACDQPAHLHITAPHVEEFGKACLGRDRDLEAGVLRNFCASACSVGEASINSATEKHAHGPDGNSLPQPARVPLDLRPPVPHFTLAAPPFTAPGPSRLLKNSFWP